MSARNYRINEPITVRYLSQKRRTGLSVTMAVFNGLDQSIPAQSGPMSEISDWGVYSRSFTPNTAGDWFVLITDNKGGSAIKSFSVGNFNIELLGDLMNNPPMAE